MSYAELNRRANQLAHFLRWRGVGPDARVAICVERGLPMIVALLGTLKAGGGYVPLDPSYPAERLTHMLADSAPLAVLVDGVGRAALGGAVRAELLVDLERELPLWQEDAASNPSS